MSDGTQPVDHNPDTAFEASDWRVRPIALTLLGICLVVVIAVIALRAAFVSSTADAYRPLTVTMPAPRLQTNPAADLTGLRSREDHDLNAYYWIDHDKGIVHIPIGEAMKRVAVQGIEGFPAGGSQ